MSFAAFWDTRNRWGAGFFFWRGPADENAAGPGRKGWLCGRRGRVVRVPGRGMFGGSFFLRPNYALAAVLLCICCIYRPLRDHRFGLVIPAVAGLSLAVLMTLHNLYFGHKFFLITSVATTASLTASPMTYVRALSEWIARPAGNGQAPDLIRVIHQMQSWFWTPPIQQFPIHKGISFLLMLRLFTLLLTFCGMVVSPKRFPRIALLAWIALAVHIPMLFVFDTKFRYDLLGWDLSMIVTIMLVACIWENKDLIGFTRMKAGSG